MQMICILLGVPESERHWLFEAIEPSFDFGGSRKAAITRLSVEEASSRMYAYGQELIAAKRAQPTDAMLSGVVNSEDPALSDIESYLFFNLLFSAGAETTRNSIAGGLLALAENPGTFEACVPTRNCCRPPSRRWCGGPRRHRRSGAPRPRPPLWPDTASNPGRRSSCGRARPTATPPPSRTRPVRRLP